MKLLGIQIPFTKSPIVPPAPEPIRDEVPEIKAAIPDTKKPTLIPKVPDPTLNYVSVRSQGRGAFKTSEYNLAEIGRIEDTDSYVRQSFDKKVGLLLKEGWDFVGPNLRTIRYIKARFSQIAQASSIPTEQLFRDIASAVIRKSNCFIIKVRDVKASGGRVRSEVGKTASIKPVAAYFIAPAETMEYEMTNNKITKWRQCMPDGSIEEYNPRDVVHIYFDRKEGFIFGTPTLIPVIDDIRALRKIEENIELLVYQHLFPLFQYKVGTDQFPASTTETGEREIDVVRREIMYMPSEGGIVTPHTHEITAIGAEGRALRADGYLTHFKKRVFSGLGVSAVDMGEGETANRATADNMSRNLVDAVKDIQKVLEVAINEFLIKELLLESTFGESILDEENLVSLKFKEVDTTDKIKKEAHAADLFAKDIVTHDEARRVLGLEPLKLPTADEVEQEVDMATLYPEWSRMRWKLFEEPKLLIQSIDEPYSLAAKANAANPSTSLTGGQIQQAGEEQTAQTEAEHQRQLELEKEKAKIKKAATPKKKDGFLSNTFEETKKDTIARITEKRKYENEWISGLIRTQMSSSINKMLAEQLVAFRTGYNLWAPANTEQFISDVSMARIQLRSRIEFYINRLTEHVINALRRNVNNELPLEEMPRIVRAVFESVEYRADFIEDVEVRRANRYGQVVAARAIGVQKMVSDLSNHNDTCHTCLHKEGHPIDTITITLDDVPPYHAGCNCTLGIYRTAPVKDSMLQRMSSKGDNIDDPPDEMMDSGDIAKCPDCGKTALKKKDTPDTYCCRACGLCFYEEEAEDVEDTTEVDSTVEDGTLEKCVLGVKRSLRKEHPEWSEDKIKSSAFAICNAKRSKKG